MKLQHSWMLALLAFLGFAQAVCADPTSKFTPPTTELSDADVISVYGDMFESDTPSAAWETNWGGATNTATDYGEKIVFGSQWTAGFSALLLGATIDLRLCKEAHIWVYSESADVDKNIGLELQTNGGNKGTGLETDYKLNGEGTWQEVVIPLSAINGLTTSDMQTVKNVVLSAVNGVTIWVSNIYFTLKDEVKKAEDGFFWVDLEQGGIYTFEGIDSEWIADRDFFTTNGDGTFVFNAISGRYKLTPEDTNKWLRVEPLVYNESTGYYDYASYNADGTGTIWVIGNAGIAKPDYTSNGKDWQTSNTFSLAPIESNKYKLTLEVGKELRATNVQFKFFAYKDAWNTTATTGKEFNAYGYSGDVDGTATYTNYNIYIENENATTNPFRRLDMESGNDNGNIVLKDGYTLTERDVWEFTLDCSNPAHVKIIVKKVFTNTEDLKPAPTPTHHPADVYAIYSDYYVAKGMNPDGTAVPTEKTFVDDTTDHYTLLNFSNGHWFHEFFKEGAVDLSKYQYLHIDFHQIDGTDTEFYVSPRIGADYPNDEETHSNYAQINILSDTNADGWMSVDLPLVDNIEYSDKDTGETKYASLSEIQKLTFINAEGAHFAVDNIYFWKNPETTITTTDTDGKGLDWNTETGTTCYLDQLVWSTHEGEDVNPLSHAHDGDTNTYYGISKEQSDGDLEEVWIVGTLKKSITVSDVEVVWANGYASDYEVYVSTASPLTNNAVDKNKIRLLYEVSDQKLDYEPYYDIHSNLQDKANQNEDSNYIILHFTQRGNGITFGYKVDELHVGAYDDDYNTVYKVGIDDYVIRTNETITPTVTARNKRNAILPDEKVTSYSFAEKNNVAFVKINGKTIGATASGDYTIVVSGTVEGIANVENGSGSLTVYRDWTSSSVSADEETKKSIVQTRSASDFSSTPYENPYAPQYAGDGVEATNDRSRFSIFNGNRSVDNYNQWWMVDLGKSYSITDMEIVWERAFAAENGYAVYGFTEEPDADTKAAVAALDESVASHMLYKSGSSFEDVSSFPYHEVQFSNENGGNIVSTSDNYARYLILGLNRPVVQPNGDWYGFSFWEVYAYGVDVEALTKVSLLEAPDIRVRVRSEKSQSVTALGDENASGEYESIRDEKKYNQQIKNFTPVDFAITGYKNGDIEMTADANKTTTKEISKDGAVDSKATQTVYKDANGETVASLVSYKKQEGDYVIDFYEFYNADGELIATIYDNTDGTYAVEAGSLGNKNISYNVHMTGVNGVNDKIEGDFNLTIYKEEMKLVEDETTETKQVYDDGYFSQEVLNKNAKSTVTVIDMRNVDFVTDNDGKDLSDTKITAPRYVTETTNNGKRMNPNTIMYVHIDDEQVTKDVFTDTNPLKGDYADKIVHGGNVALEFGEGANRSYLIPDLEIFDAWDYDPLADVGTDFYHARFYTSIPTKKKSIITLPFHVRETDLTNRSIKLYKPTKFNADNKTVELTDVTEKINFQSETMGIPYIIYTETASNYKAGGYAVTFHNATYKGNKESDGWTSVNTFLPMMYGDVFGNGNGLTGTYKTKKVTGADNVYLYSISQDKFLSVGDAAFKNDAYNGSADNNYGTTVYPFYASLTLSGSSAKAVNGVRFLFADEYEATGIQTVGSGADAEVSVYTVDGVLVRRNVRAAEALNGLSKGIYVVNGKKVVK